MNVYYATFGFGTDKRHKQQPIEAPIELVAVMIMHEIYDDKWAFIYDEDQNQENLPMITARKPV